MMKRFTKADLEAWLERHGYVRDRWDNYVKTFSSHLDGTSRTYRYKLKKIAVRREVKLPDGRWSRMQSAYYTHLSLSEDDKLRGLSR